jgi:uncharacterized delta-60 repeat protein
MSFELPGLGTSSADVLSTNSLPPVFAQNTLTTPLTGLGGASQSLLFVDGSVTDYQQLVAGVTQGTEIHVLDPVQDAVTQITNTLLGRQNIASLHIVSHGEAGGLDFGSSQLNLGDLPGYASQLQSWGKALTNDADLLLYGCDVAQGELGKAFTSILSQLTGADIAASNDITGNASKGGNWTLEYQTGSIEAELAFQAGTLNQYSHRLLAGDLDTTFGTGGKVVTDIVSSYDEGRSVAIDSSGNIVVAGYADNGSGSDFALARYTSTGILDTNFGTGGKVVTDIGSSYDEGRSVAIDSSGNIVVAGYADNGSGSDFALARYTSTGILDTNFGTGGKVVTDIGSSYDYGNSVAIDSSGNIVVAGYADNGSGSDFALARYTSTGILDTNFGTGGKVVTDIGSSYDYGNSVAIDSSGNIVVAGFADNGSNSDFALARYTSTGILDTNFGTGGKVVTDIGSSYDYGNSVAIDSSGNIVVAGFASNGSNYDFALARYTSTGILDTNFGTGGKVVTDIGSSYDYGNSVAIDSSGKIVVAGFASNGSNYDFALARYTSTGILDTNFGTGGKVVTDIGSSYDYGNSVAIDSSGNIVVAGYADNGSNSDFALARYDNISLPTVSLSTSTANITEGDTGTFTLDRGSNTTGALTVNLTINGTSTVTSGDYTLSGASVTVSGSNLTVVIPDTQSAVTLNMAALAEAMGFAEAADLLKLNLATGTGYSVGSSNNASITIAANGFTVINTNDTGEGSLRQAILNANAIAGTDMITFAGSTFTDATPDTIALTSGELGINSDVTIQGTGANLLTLSGNNASRVFNISSGVVGIDGVAIANGNSGTDRGGGILNTGTLTVNNSIIRNNTANDAGGGIYSKTGNLTVNNSTINNNSTGFSGGGLYLAGVGTITNSTINNNTSSTSGGGITSGSTTIGSNTILSNLTLINSTISGNTATTNGGGLRVVVGGVMATLTNVTIANNTATTGTGGGISTGAGSTTNVKNTIVATNTNSSNPDVAGAYVSQGNNLIGKSDGSTGFTNGANGDLVGAIAAPINPLLAPLADNGGTTQTHALLPGSAAINAGTTTGAPTADQRGISRVGAVDIGAFESRGFTIAVASGTTQSADKNTLFGNPLVATVSSASGETVDGGVITFTAPGTGASTTVTTKTATIASGQASVTEIANNTVGSYSVTASANGITTPTNFSLTNTNTPPTVTNVSKTGQEDNTVSFSSADFTSQFNDANSDSLNKIQITALPTKGILQVGGSSVNLNQEITAAQLSTLTYIPNSNSNGSDSFGWNGSDGTDYATTSATVNLAIAPVNDAPSLTGNATLTAVTQNTTNPSGSSLTSLFGSLFSDIDTDASLSGLAIVSNTATTQGRWEYSTDGTNWANVGAVADDATALALSASTLVRFVPAIGYSGTPPGLTVRALDNSYSSGFTTDTTRVTVNTTSNGGTTAISSGTPAALDTSVTQNLANLVWRNSGTGENAVWQLNNFTLQSAYFLPTVADPNWQIASTADFNSDGIADLLWRNKASGENVIWQMNSTGFETDHFITKVPDANWQIVSTADFNSDGIADILWRNKASGENVIWQMKGDFTLQSDHFITQVPDANWKIVSTNDFNGDGIADILWRNKASGENVIWQMKNDFTLQSDHFITQVPDANWEIAGTDDFNGDGIADILWRNKASGENVIWQMKSDFTLQSDHFITQVPDINWQIAGTDDFNHDGTPDILWRNKLTAKEDIWEMNGFSLVQGYQLVDVIDPNWSVRPFVAG